ncbi:MAG TPA: hypothetical protein VF530_05405 [Planctomycetota bacterium]
MSRPLLGALAGLALVPACRAPRSSAPVQPPEARVATTEARASATESAVRSIEAGQLDQARALLDRLVLDEHRARARQELASGAPEDALLAIDRALALAPEDPELRLLKADASLRLAETRIAAGGGSGALIEGTLMDALEAYRATGESAHALFGASRAAWLLGRTDEGLALARRGLTLLGPEEAGASLGQLVQSPQRIHAEQVFAAYVQAQAAGAEEARALALECEEALGRVLGRTMDDPWAWRSLADLHEREGRAAQARDACLLGLKRLPADAGLLERLTRTAAAAGGPATAVALLEAHLALHGPLAATRWHLAVARFQVALAGLKGPPRELAPAPFQASEAEFQALGEELADYGEAALGYAVVSRLARGWCAFHAGDLQRARAVFLSLDELRPRGVEWSLPGELESGIQGLYLVADALGQREEKAGAGEVFETLHALQPEVVDWANNAGFFLRDAAYDLESDGRDLCRAARGRITNPEARAELRALAGLDAEPPGSEAERAAFERAANERLARARALMPRSWNAYRVAAELAPEDVRVLNDAALVLVYYLHHDLEWAEEVLLRAVELGGPQLEAKRAALALEESPERAQALEAEIALLEEAWGDAHQNLGVLAWVHRHEREAAERWLVRALEIGPERLPVKNSLLPQVRGELAPEEDDVWDLLSWAQPCKTP